MAFELKWKKSSRSVPNGACVEMAVDKCGRVLLRDSKDPDGPTLSYGANAWSSFLQDIRNDRLDRPEG